MKSIPFYAEQFIPAAVAILESDVRPNVPPLAYILWHDKWDESHRREALLSIMSFIAGNN